jgi:hypothetical protein
MKTNLLLYLLLFSQIILSQNKSPEKQFIELEVTNKHYVDAKDKSYRKGDEAREGFAYLNCYSSGYNRVVSKNKTIMIFDLNGKIQQRKGYQIKKSFKSKPKDLIEIYNYDKNGFLFSILEQEKINKNLLEKTFLQQFYYNDKKQLTEKIFVDLKKDSIVKRVTFQYDINGNNIKIASDSLHYTIKEYDTNNQIISATTFNNGSLNYNNAYKNDENIKVVYYRNDQNSTLFKTNITDQKTYYPNGLLKENEKSNDLGNFKKNKKYVYLENGLLKNLEISNSYYVDNYLLQQTFTVKSDFKDTLNRKVATTINSQICSSDIWE